MTSSFPEIPFNPVGRGFRGWPMPSSVPAGMRLELSRAMLLTGQEARFEEWMEMLNARYDECVATLSQERMAFEATFVNQEADGSWWMYHVQLGSTQSPGLVTDNDLDRDHEAFARATKHAGWEELQPKFMPCPEPVREALIDAARD
ncbi:MAG: DUF6176 family protein [Galactobacter sp.]